MQTAALVSVVAVGSSLIYLLIEKLLYNKMCRTPLGHIKKITGTLFASISAEKFLYELLRETKIQNNSSENLMNAIPDEFKNSPECKYSKQPCTILRKLDLRFKSVE